MNDNRELLSDVSAFGLLNMLVHKHILLVNPFGPFRLTAISESTTIYRKLLTMTILGLFLNGYWQEDRYEPRRLVSGKVTFQGQPGSEDVVSFFNPDSNLTTSGNLKSDGNYTLLSVGSRDVPHGKYVVTV